MAIFAVLEEGGEAYLAIEHAAGRTLHELLKLNVLVARRQALPSLKQIAAALDYAHGQRIIHRGLKPANVMVDDKGQVKAMGFGSRRLAYFGVSTPSQGITSLGPSG